MKYLTKIKNIDDLWQVIKRKKCFCFGAGRQLAEICDDIPGLSEQIEGIIDNNVRLHNTTKVMAGKTIPIHPVEVLLAQDAENTILLITSSYKFERLSTVNTGSGFGAKPGFPILKELMEFYDGLEFEDKADPGQLILCPVYETAILKKHGLKLNGNFQIVDDMSVYPVMYFNAKSLYSNRLRITEKTISVHHCTWTWAGEKNKL